MAKTITISISDVEEKILYDNLLSTVTKDGVDNEGIKDCLKREFSEEMNLKIEVCKLFFINDFLQISAFNSKDQLLSIYYEVTTKDWQQIENCIKNPTVEQSFYWKKISDLKNENITFPIDKIVCKKLIHSNQ